MEDQLIELGYVRKKSAPHFTNAPIAEVDVFSKADTGTICFNVYRTSDGWEMTDSWSKLIGRVHSTAEVSAWERFVKTKRLI